MGGEFGFLAGIGLQILHTSNPLKVVLTSWL